MDKAKNRACNRIGGTTTGKSEELEKEKDQVVVAVTGIEQLLERIFEPAMTPLQPVQTVIVLAIHVNGIRCERDQWIQSSSRGQQTSTIGRQGHNRYNQGISRGQY